MLLDSKIIIPDIDINPGEIDTIVIREDSSYIVSFPVNHSKKFNVKEIFFPRAIKNHCSIPEILYSEHGATQ